MINNFNCMMRIFIKTYVLHCLVLFWGMGLCYAEPSNAEILKRANHGDVEAQRIIGKRLFFGLNGAPVQRNNAIKWFKKAAERGDAQSLCILGELYENGTNVKKDLDTARMYYRKAAAAGSKKAAEKLTRIQKTAPVAVAEKKEIKPQEEASQPDMNKTEPDMNKTEPDLNQAEAISVLCRNENGKKPLPVGYAEYYSLSGECRFNDEHKAMVIMEDGRKAPVYIIKKMEQETVKIARLNAQEATSVYSSKKWNQIADFVNERDFCSDPLLLCVFNTVVRWANDHFLERVTISQSGVWGMVDDSFLREPKIEDTYRKNILKIQGLKSMDEN